MLNDAELKQYIGKKIKEFRKKSGMTQGELAEKIGVKNNTVSAYERGIADPPQSKILKLSEVFNCSVDDLFPSTGDNSEWVLEEMKKYDTEGFGVKDMLSLKMLVEKAQSLDGEERAKFFDDIRWAVERYGNNKS